MQLLNHFIAHRRPSFLSLTRNNTAVIKPSPETLSGTQLTPALAANGFRNVSHCTARPHKAAPSRESMAESCASRNNICSTKRLVIVKFKQPTMNELLIKMSWGKLIHLSTSLFFLAYEKIYFHIQNFLQSPQKCQRVKRIKSNLRLFGMQISTWDD